MHDTHLLEKIYNSLAELCNTNCIAKINEISITVSQDSHINEHNLLDFLKDRDNCLFGDQTKIFIERQQKEELTANINRVEGESF